MKQAAFGIMAAVRGIARRPGPSLLAIVAVAGASAVLLGYLARSVGFEQMLRASGSRQTAIFLRPGSETENNSLLGPATLAVVQQLPGVARNAGEAVLSTETSVFVGQQLRSGEREWLPLRGVGADPRSVHQNFTLVQGRMFRPGTHELIVGRGANWLFRGIDVGGHPEFGDWTVVGEFADGGSAYESELWGDESAVRQSFSRGESYGVIYARLESEKAVSQLASAVVAAKLKVDMMSTTDYFAEINRQATDFALDLAWPLALLAALAAISCVTNAISASVLVRHRELAGMRAHGRFRLALFTGVLIESCTLAVLGAIAGALIVYLFVDGSRFTTMLWRDATFTVVTARMPWNHLVDALLLSQVIGLAGAVVPAFRAARTQLPARVSTNVDVSA